MENQDDEPQSVEAIIVRAYNMHLLGRRHEALSDLLAAARLLTAVLNEERQPGARIA